MDAREWVNLRTSQPPARWINNRYLVVPIDRTPGVFHPKLHLLLSENGFRLLCGSNNLTRSGCTDNLEIVNVIPVEFSENAPGESDYVTLAAEALAFFKQALAFAHTRVSAIAQEWLDDCYEEYPWASLTPESPDKSIRLVHTLGTSLWDQLQAAWKDDKPKSISIISPFFDRDLRLLKRLRKQFPKCRIEVTAQQYTSNLPASLIKRAANIQLYSISNHSRRLHGKLLAWQCGRSNGCLVGSANFTSAALDGTNVEACLLLTTETFPNDELFDRTFSRKKILPQDFTPGSEPSPEEQDETSTGFLRVDNAVLDENDDLHVEFRCRVEPKPDKLSLALRGFRDIDPLKSWSVPVKDSGTRSVRLSDSIMSQLGGAATVSLVATSSGVRTEGAPTWIVQQAKLTQEHSGGSSHGVKRKIEDTGAGLPEFLEELGRAEGIKVVIDYLTRLTIRFYDGAAFDGKGGRFRLKRNDPFRPDTPAEWLTKSKNKAEMEEAIMDFVDRHERIRLRRHAERGNLNGVENFLDIFVTMIRLLYVYHRQGSVNRMRLLGTIPRYVQIATVGFETSSDSSYGFLKSLAHNLSGDPSLLQKRCEAVNIAGHLRAALFVGQMVRWDQWEENGPRLPRHCFPSQLKELKEGLEAAGLPWPSVSATVEALQQYQMLNDLELAEWRRQLVEK